MSVLKSVLRRRRGAYAARLVERLEQRGGEPRLLGWSRGLRSGRTRARGEGAEEEKGWVVEEDLRPCQRFKTLLNIGFTQRANQWLL